jgi:flagellar biogenesis protein FliO
VAMEFFKNGNAKSNILLLLINVASTAILVGIAWGTLHSQVDALEQAVEHLGELQAAWNLEEHRTDDAHRERMGNLEEQIFTLLNNLQKRNW